MNARPERRALDAAAAAAVVARLAATTLIVRDGSEGFEVLMVRRSPQASFMPGAYVFPGGAVDAADADAGGLCDETAAALQARVGDVMQIGARALAGCVGALRECFEECGLWLGVDAAPAGGWAPWRARLHRGEGL